MANEISKYSDLKGGGSRGNLGSPTSKKDISQYSDPERVQELAHQLLGKKAEIFISPRINKKYYIINPESGQKIHFGQLPYEDYTKHKDEKRRQFFQTRNKQWKDKPKYTAAWLSYHLLW